ncbi:replication-relaxation family protein [Streptomyces sp. NBC_01003]|uniref:replication-relaxation family protein n=1 Tax=Streptomyces sp. NBC_01003 TaxID=2903714 RepID=UPI003868C02D|nr:replication-relaxation family protein [Streptomyces sp. NBC_01003]
MSQPSRAYRFASRFLGCAVAQYGSVQADLVTIACQHQLPLMSVEVDRSTMVPERVVAKIRRYQQHVERRDRQGRLWW